MMLPLKPQEKGVHWSFSPMLDLSRDPRWGRCVESPGEDPYVGMKMAEAVVKGFQEMIFQNRIVLPHAANII